MSELLSHVEARFLANNLTFNPSRDEPGKYLGQCPTHRTRKICLEFDEAADVMHVHAPPCPCLPYEVIRQLDLNRDDTAVVPYVVPSQRAALTEQRTTTRAAVLAGAGAGTAGDAYERLTAALEAAGLAGGRADLGARSGTGRYTCPACGALGDGHGLKVDRQPDGRALFHCHGCGAGAEILEALELTWGNLGWTGSGEGNAPAGDVLMVPTGSAREVGDYPLPSPNTPAPAARAIYERLTGSGRLLWFWRGDWYVRHAAHWAPVEVAQVRTWIYRETEAAYYQAFNDKTEQWERKAWNPAPQRVNATLDALQHAVAYRPGDLPEDRCIALQNGVFDLASGLLQVHDPLRFNLASLPYAYDPAAHCPAWLGFLGEQIPDQESRLLLQEYAGYLIIGRTDLQKVLHLYGVRRGGKGTVARVLEALVGQENTASVTLKSLTGAFGEQPLIGKSMAVVTDANWKIRDVETAVEALKSISGEDSRDVNRKHRETWHGKLGVRFIIIGNDEPEFRDASGALLGRMIHIYFGRSVFGREDPTLTARLLAELPGVFNWALDGLRSLTARGRLFVPQASQESERDIARSTSPVAGFLEDRITFMDPAAGAAEWLDDLYQAYTAWCIGNGQRFELQKTQFSKALKSACSGHVDVRRERRTSTGNPQPRYHGVMLAPGQTRTLADGTPMLR